MEEILSFVKSGLLFGVFGSIILMICPNKSYQKHIGLVVGMLFILVMLHPIMVFLDVDGDTYVSYIRNFLMIENNGSNLTGDNILIYEDSVESQLTAIFLERGYPVKDICVDSDSEGKIIEVSIAFSDAVAGLDEIEQYIKRLFGEEVRVKYER